MVLLKVLAAKAVVVVLVELTELVAKVPVKVECVLSTVAHSAVVAAARELALAVVGEAKVQYVLCGEIADHFRQMQEHLL